MHVPVLLQEVCEGLRLTAGTNCLDGTVGLGGHARKILRLTAPTGRVVGFDRDSKTLAAAKETLVEFGNRFIPIHDTYANLAVHSAELEVAKPIGAILLDLGLSSLQLDDQDGGFAWRYPEARLDMRFDVSGGETVADLLNRRTEEELAVLFSKYGEVRRSKGLAREIVARREQQSFATAGDLLAAVEKVMPNRPHLRTHPATTVFQALRIAVNRELDQLEEFLPRAIDLLAPGGRLAIISFHSIEDRIVKKFLRKAATECVCPPEILECRCEHHASVKNITKKPIVPSDEEVAVNPRSRSAKLRIAEKI